MSDNKNPFKEIWVNKFDEEAALKFREQIVKATDDAPTDEYPIVVYIDSYGGYVYGCVSMLDTIDSVPNPIVTVCVGKAMSAGAILLSHGDLRLCAPNCTVMVHEMSSCTHGHIDDILSDAAYDKKLNRRIMTILARNCGIKGGYKGLRRRFKDRDGGREWYMFPDEALEFGIIDAIGLPLIEPQMGFIIRTAVDKPRNQLMRLPTPEEVKKSRKRKGRK